ncbi:hypothetical protein Acor_09830 [Acrocarpospora corrugata]|uniref:Uncharacterized protein n=1 Tax=Acrocarpospora corrugata TaxID=35763 RepID=A0A5M3VSH6_9ACTN|nr:hypothetical protein Acor_09830 [Acrocarpospora corrugata]
MSFFVWHLVSHYSTFTPTQPAPRLSGTEEIKPGRILDTPGPWGWHEGLTGQVVWFQLTEGPVPGETERGSCPKFARR